MIDYNIESQRRSRRTQTIRRIIYLAIRYQFKWQFVRFIIFNYYLIEAVVASSMYSAYLLTVTTLLPLNIVFFVYLTVDFLLKIICTEQPQFLNEDDYYKPKKLLKYYLFKKLLILDIIFLVVFITSYFVPFSSARVLRMIILIKLIDIADFNNKIYEKIHTFKVFRKVYTILKISYVILLFSHYFGTWFYLIDQNLIDEQHYGTPAFANEDYYQMNLLCYTPIEQLGDGGRYLYGLYFMVSLITTIAYGDIIGKNAYEQVFVCVMMVLSTVSLALILEQFMDLVRYDSLGLYDFIKKYNSLKTFMDDSQVSYEIQNRVRSYLVYTQYEKKYHAHEEVVQKLTQKLQLDLKVQSYSQMIAAWIIPCMPELQGQIKQLCNISKLISFQAQTDIYEELQTVNTASQCCFLYKIGGHIEQYIELSKSRARFSTNERKAFGLSRLFLNFNMELAYDSDQEEQLQFQIDQLNQQNKHKYHQLVKANERKLRSIKISQFIMLDAEEFYEFVNLRKGWFKRIKQLKQDIISQDIPLKLLGEYCMVCSGYKSENHTVQNCPSLHLTYNQRVIGCQPLDELVLKQQMRGFQQRKSKPSRKIFTTNLLMKNIFELGKKIQQPVKPVLEQKVISIFKHLIANVNLKSHEQYLIKSDSLYDPHGLSSKYSIPHQ